MLKKFIHTLTLFVFLSGMLLASPPTPARAATLTVTNTNDSGAGSLRQAILNAVDGDTIDATGISGTIILASQITINKNLTIQGPGSDQLTVSGNNTVRVLEINNVKTVSISGLTVANGRVVDSHGAGIMVLNIGTTLLLNDVDVINNMVAKSGSDFNRGGGIHIADGTSLTMSNGSVSGNTAQQNGGGIHVGFNASVSLNNVVIDNNNLEFYGSSGGGISIRQGSTATLNRVMVTNNTAKSGGGGLYSDASVTIMNSVFTNNSVVNDSFSGSGGGLNISGSNTSVSIENTTISGNSVSNPINSAYGGGIVLFQPATLSLNNVTIANNTSQVDGGGIYRQNNSVVNLGNSIIAGNNTSDDASDDCSGTLNSLGYNLIQVTTGCTVSGDTTGNITGVPAELAPLGNYGGSTLTHALLPASPALDSADNATCESEDQRGITRPKDGDNDTTLTCDMGAYEHEYESVAPTVISILRADANPTSASSVNFTVTFSEAVTGVSTIAPFADFTLFTTGVTGASITGVTPVSASVYTVSVNTGSGNGTIRLDVPSSASIKDFSNNDLSGLPFNTGEVYSIFKTPSFVDVPFDYWSWSFIERLYAAGITGGCGSGIYCPTQTVTRDQMAVFLLRGIHGSTYTPPAVGGSTGFTDVPTDHWAAAWIKQLAAEGITGGCGPNLYCPDAMVTRDQMAIFLLRAKYTSTYTPPAVGGSTGFTDVPTDFWAAAWIKQLAFENITGGCGTNLYCPDTPVTRDQMAVFLVRTFNLP